VSFGTGTPFSVGLEEELLLVDPETHGLVHEAERVLPRMGVEDERAGYEAFAAEVELRSAPCRTPGDAAAELRDLRAAARGAGATLLGMGLHPTAEHGDVRITDNERYRKVDDTMRGLIRRTPECALHVHVGMPDERSAVNAHNALRCLLPLLEGLAANSPFWFGKDSGLASARYALTRAYPRRGVPRALRDMEEWEEVTTAAVAAGGLDDYTSLWWDVRPQPRLGTVEVREMDVQADTGRSAALAALVQAVAARASERPPATTPPSEALEESSFRAARDGLAAQILHEGGVVPLPEAARATVGDCLSAARDLGTVDALEGIERILTDGCGADRRRSAFDRGRMPEVLREVVEETAA
jgi:carboxylate-amine ligase